VPAPEGAGPFSSKHTALAHRYGWVPDLFAADGVATPPSWCDCRIQPATRHGSRAAYLLDWAETMQDKAERCQRPRGTEKACAAPRGGAHSARAVSGDTPSITMPEARIGVEQGGFTGFGPDRPARRGSAGAVQGASRHHAGAGAGQFTR